MLVIGRRAVPALALAAMAILLASPPAQAACGLTREAVAAADVVFVGLLTAVDSDGVATFDLEEVWRGEAFTIGGTASVQAPNLGLEARPPGATSRYLVLAAERNGVLYTGDGPNACDRFPFPWDASYATFRPAQPAPQSQESFEAVGIPLLPILIGAAVVISIGAFAIGASGRRSRSE